MTAANIVGFGSKDNDLAEDERNTSKQEA